MKFEHRPFQDRDDEGGQVVITIETEAEAQDWLRWYAREEDPRKQVAFLDSLPREVLRGSAKRPYYRCYGSFDLDMSEPYVKRLAQFTGYEHPATLPDLDFAEACGRLKATRILERLYTEHGHFCFEAWVEAEPWNGKTAPEYADQLARKYVEDEIGDRPHVPEFLQNRNGTYSPNPKYATGYTPAIRPAVRPDIWRVLVEWWRDNHATPAQLDLLSRYSRYGKLDTSHPFDANHYQGFHVDNYTRHVTWEEFQGAGKA